MVIAAAAFRDWLAGTDLPGSVSTLATVLDVRRSTIQKQFIRGRVQESLVVIASRTAGLNPIDQLAGFEPYTDLRSEMRPPTQAEVQSQLSYEDVLRELLCRIRPAYRELLAPLAQLSPIPHAGSVKDWIDAVDPGDLRRELSSRTGIAPPNLSSQLTQGRLTPAVAVEAARIARVSLASGLLVTGLITAQEADWLEGVREQTLTTLPISELIELTRDKLAALQKTAKRRAEELNSEQRFLDTLG